jgi:hypothetical protein
MWCLRVYRVYFIVRKVNKVKNKLGLSCATFSLPHLSLQGHLLSFSLPFSSCWWSTGWRSTRPTSSLTSRFGTCSLFLWQQSEIGIRNNSFTLKNEFYFKVFCFLAYTRNFNFIYTIFCQKDDFVDHKFLCTLLM